MSRIDNQVLMMKHTLLWPMVLFLSVGCSEKTHLTNISGDRSSEDRLTTCIEGLRVSDLIPKEETTDEAVRFDASPAAMDSAGCDGIYYYATFSKPFRRVIVHGEQGDSRYMKYYLVVILEGKMYPLATNSERYRRQFLKRKKHVLTDKFGESLVTKLGPSILSGYKRLD